MLRKTLLATCIAGAGIASESLAAGEALVKRQFEYLDRGVVAVRQNNSSALVSWRSLATDESDLGFNVYRTTDGKTVKLNQTVLTKGTNFTDGTADFSKANTYSVKKVLNGVELGTNGSYTMPANKGIGAYVFSAPVRPSRTAMAWAFVPLSVNFLPSPKVTPSAIRTITSAKPSESIS